MYPWSLVPWSPACMSCHVSDHHLAALSGHMSDILYLGELKLAIRNTQYAVRVKVWSGHYAKRKTQCGSKWAARSTQYAIRNTQYGMKLKLNVHEGGLGRRRGAVPCPLLPLCPLMSSECRRVVQKGLYSSTALSTDDQVVQMKSSSSSSAALLRRIEGRTQT